MILREYISMRLRISPHNLKIYITPVCRLIKIKHFHVKIFLAIHKLKDYSSLNLFSYT